MKKHALVLSIIAASLALTACNQNAGQPKAASGAAAPAAASSASGAVSAPASAAPVAGLETESKQLGYLLGYQFAMSAQLGTLKKSGVEVDTD